MELKPKSNTVLTQGDTTTQFSQSINQKRGRRLKITQRKKSAILAKSPLIKMIDE